MAAATRSASGRSVLTLVSVMILIGVEVFGVAIAGGWALAGLLELPDSLGYGLTGLFGLLGIYVMVQLYRRASEVDAIHH